MKKITILFACSFALLFQSCATDGADASSAAATAPKIETSNVANEVSKALTNTGETVNKTADNLIPSDTKVDEKIDKVADKLKGVFNKGKNDVADGIKKKTEAVTQKADKAVKDIAQKSKDMGKKIESKIEQTSAKVEQKVDKAIESIPAPAPTTQRKPFPKPSPKPTKPATPAAAPATPKKEVKATAPGNVVTKKVWGKNDKPNHDYFNTLLQKHVSSSGKVNYKGFKADNHLLEDYLSQLKNNPIHPDWSRKEKLAYWINAYNAFTVKLIVDHYPVKSIQDINNGKPWDKKWIKLGDKTYSLNNIENDIIRPQFKEPRIHFAVNCAAKSCPPISNSAWTSSNLESKFESATKKFINNSQHNSISEKNATISNIFNWYKEDFGDLTAFLNKYSSTKLKSGGEISFKDYDWSLNE